MRRRRRGVSLFAGLVLLLAQVLAFNGHAATPSIPDWMASAICFAGTGDDHNGGGGPDRNHAAELACCPGICWDGQVLLSGSDAAAIEAPRFVIQRGHDAVAPPPAPRPQRVASGRPRGPPAAG